MRWLSNFRRMSVLAAVLLWPAQGAAAATDDDGNRLRVFSGEPRLIVVNGYSTSRRWPTILQRKLDRYFGGRRVIEIRTAIKSGSPITKWIDSRSGRTASAWDRVLRPAIESKGERPAIVLAQQSLQGAYGAGSNGIRGQSDAVGIALGADTIQTYVERLFDTGADVVFVATHIFKKPLEPAIGNERLALAALMARGVPNLHAGPDVWQATKANYPAAYAGDGVHPNSLGAEIMAQSWFEVLLRHDGLVVPPWSRKTPNRAPGSASGNVEAEPETEEGIQERRRTDRWERRAGRGNQATTNP